MKTPKHLHLVISPDEIDVRWCSGTVLIYGIMIDALCFFNEICPLVDVLWILLFGEASHERPCSVSIDSSRIMSCAHHGRLPASLCGKQARNMREIYELE